MKVGIVGAGRISGQYLTTLDRLAGVEVAAVADLDPERARAAAAGRAGVEVMDVATLLARSEIEAVLNLTVPAAHAEVSAAALRAGKHVYSEKPLGLSVAEGRQLLTVAAQTGYRLGCAPDTVLGTGTQTARHAVEAGLIGELTAATAFLAYPGPDPWHPDPEFYFRAGGGPLLDMGPYYLSALVHLAGPFAEVVGMSSRPRSRRTIGTGPRAGTEFDVEVDTHVTGVLRHESGVLSTVVMSFDIVHARLPHVEVYGTTGSLSVPSPNGPSGEVLLAREWLGEWTPIPVAAGYVDGERGVGLADLARGVELDRPHRASAELALHVLEAMELMLVAAETGSVQRLTTTCAVPDLVPLVTDPTDLDT